MMVRVILAAALAAGLALAQPGGGSEGVSGGGMGGGGSRNGRGGMGDDMGGMGGMMPRRQSRLEMLEDKLKLKSDQKAEVEKIFSAAAEKAGPVRDQLTKGRQVIAQAMLSKAGDDDIKKLLTDYATVNAQMTGIEAEAFAKIYALLKPNQQAKAPEVFVMMAGMFAGGGGGGGNMGRGRGNRGGGE
jgi:Spy/CpxP family protein refolding chaperone